jgi:hypothetical protein
MNNIPCIENTNTKTETEEHQPTRPQDESINLAQTPLSELVEGHDQLPRIEGNDTAQDRYNSKAPFMAKLTANLLVEKHGWELTSQLGEDYTLEKPAEGTLNLQGGIACLDGRYYLPADIHARLKGFQSTEEFLTSEGFNEVGPSKDSLNEMLERCRLTTQTEIPASRTIFRLGGVEVATNANLVDMVAQSKAGKTALLAGAVASAISGESHLGWDAQNRRGAIIYIDTEQSLADCRRSVIDNALTRCGIDEMPDNLLVYNVKRERTNDAWMLVTHAMEQASKEFGCVYAVIIDGVADLVSSVNDEQESTEKVAALLNLAAEYDTTIFTVLHANPGARASQTDFSKGRGHLGSQLERKCETMVTLRKDEKTDSTKITAPITRGKPLMGDDTLFMQWDEDSNMFQLVEGDDWETDEEKIRPVKQLEKVWGPDLDKTWTKTQIIKRLQDEDLMDDLKVSESTARRLFTEWYPEDSMKLRSGTEQHDWLQDAGDGQMSLQPLIRETFDQLQKLEVSS